MANKMHSTQVVNSRPQPNRNASKMLSLKKIPISYVKQLNRVFKRSKSIKFDLEEDEYTLKFVPFTQYQIKPKKICVKIDKRFLIHLNVDMEFIRKILNDYPEMGNLQQMPPGLRDIAIEIAAERLLDRYDRHFNCQSSIISLSDTRWSDNMRYNLAFKIVRKKDRTKFYGSLKTNQHGIDWLVDRLDQLPKTASQKANHIPLNIAFEIGWTTLSIKDLRHIEPYDIIIIDSDFSLNDPKIIIRLSPLVSFLGRIDSAGRIKIEKTLLENMEEKMKEVSAVDKSGHKDKLDKQIDDIPVKLVFQLGETRMKFGELSNLQPGYIFDMGADLKKPVTIKANGMPVGTGELVQIGDKVGVRIFELEDY